jgi:hypothetical protein
MLREHDEFDALRTAADRKLARGLDGCMVRFETGLLPDAAPMD